METSQYQRQSRQVVAAATGINLALGVLYTWSLFKSAIRESIQSGTPGGFDWELASLNDPYALCLLMFAFMMIPAGMSQDRYGPRITAAIGGVLVGLGFLWLSQTNAYLDWLIGFGVVVGSGIAFGYASATPAAMKWFPPNRVGLIAGIVVSGFGLAAVYIAPLATYLLGQYGLSGSMLILGGAFFVAVTGLSLLLISPPDGFSPPGFVDRRSNDSASQQKRDSFKEIQRSPLELLASGQFWVVWTLYFIGAGAGLMVIGNVAGMAKASLGEAAFIVVALLAIGNAAGRVVAGSLSDRIGRKKTLRLMLLLQAFWMLAAIPITNTPEALPLLIIGVAILIGFNYGTNLAIFPAMAKELWGFKHFGMNYGMLFTAWGVGGFIMSKSSQVLVTSTGDYTVSFATAALLLGLGAALVYAVHDPREQLRK